MIKTLATGLTAFLFDLNTIFNFLTANFGKIQAPSFCFGVMLKEGSVQLHYYSQRKGLEYLMVGVL